MIKQIIAYDLVELEKKAILSESRNVFKSKIIDPEQFEKIKVEFVTKLYTPGIFIRVLLFLAALIGLTTVLGPISFMFDGIGEIGIQTLSLLLGISMLIFNEKILIKEKFHFKSGLTEALIFVGLSYLAFGLLGFNNHSILIYPLVGLLLTAFASIRYLNFTALVLANLFFVWLVFQIITDLGGVIQTLMPFIFLLLFGLIYWWNFRLKSKLMNEFFDEHFSIVQTCALLIFYLAGNYFVVQKLSLVMLDNPLPENQTVPFSSVFYGLTALVPLAYLYWGIKQKSTLILRVAMLTLAMSALTFNYYFSIGMPILTITASGALLIGIALLFFNYLKQVRSGYTREKLINNNLSSPDLMAVVASQSLGNHQMSGSGGDDSNFGGGSFGGAGAGENW